MNARYLAERRALADHDEVVDITRFGSPILEGIYIGATPDDFVALAKRAYARGDLTVEELEREIEAALTEKE